ncbi:uncharacterized protein RBU33_006045 [Hipposideros larvatus]
MSRVPGESKKDHREPEGLPDGQAWPRGQVLQRGEGAQNTEDNTKEAGEDKATEEGPFLSNTEPRKDAKDLFIHHSSQVLSTTKPVGRSWELSPLITKSFQIHDVHVTRLPQQGPFRRFTDMKAEKRLAGRKERRSRYGDVNVHKCYQFGQIFSPFQALATTEMRRLPLPQDLPMSPRVHRMGVSCSHKGNLQGLSLTPTELGLGKDDNTHEKEKPASHVKTPLFPPIVKVTKSNDAK